jgi:hypothetical protein
MAQISLIEYTFNDWILTSWDISSSTGARSSKNHDTDYFIGILAAIIQSSN